MVVRLDRGQRQFQHRSLAGGSAFLGQMADHNILLARNGARVWLFLAEDEGEQGGFARAVGPDQSDAIGAVNLQGHIFKQDLRPIGFANI